MASSTSFDPIIMRYYHELIEKRERHSPTPNAKYDKYKHMCVILDKGGEALSIGYNICKPNSCQTEHAEEMALRKLFTKYGRPKRRFTVNMLVIRTNGSNSKPCINCLRNIEKYNFLINVKYIYYSHEDGLFGIKKEKFSTMLRADDYHISSYYRHVKKVYPNSGDTDSSDDNFSD